MATGGMPFQLVVPDQKLKHLNAPAQAKLHRAVEQYAEDLLAEAGRLEANVNAGSGDPEITSTMIRDAEILLRQRLTRPRAHWMVRVLRLISVASGIITGVMADKDYLANQTHLVGFVIAVTITVASTVVVLMKE